MDESVRSLLVLARSPSWETRSRSARALAPHIDTPPARQAVLDLLRDSDDTAVGEAALEALLDRHDEAAAEVIFEAVGTATDEIAEHLLYFLARDHGGDVKGAAIRLFALGLAAEDRGPLSDGAIAVLGAIGGRSA